MRMDQISFDKLTSTAEYGSLSFDLHAPSVKSLIPPVSSSIQALLLGKVLGGEVGPDDYHYYQIRLPDATATLTIEVEVEFGAADVFVAQGYLPTSNRYEFKKLDTDVPTR